MARPGASFEDAEVASLYVHRAAYAPAALARLEELAPRQASLLDLGCGTGKIARALAPGFDRVTGIDASEAMLGIARGEPGGAAHNIAWVAGRAETAPLTGAPYDLVVAAASIHWMDQPQVFARLAAAVARRHVLAVVEGDGAHEPPWQPQWEAFLGYWIAELKRERFEPERAEGPFHARMNRYRAFVDVAGEEAFVSEPVRQQVADFIRAQHSRDTFVPCALGARTAQFDAELEALLLPHATGGWLEYAVRTSVTWGTIAASAAAV
jgi:trans-aconitate methyltransferase